MKQIKRLRQYQAADVLHRIQNCSAFSIPEATRRKLNGTSTLYTFPDGSCLQVFSATSRADTWHPDWRGKHDDVHLGPIKGAPLRINKQGD